MTKDQLKWAAAQAWFAYELPGGAVAVYDRFVIGGHSFESLERFSDYEALRAWAGY